MIMWLYRLNNKIMIFYFIYLNINYKWENILNIYFFNKTRLKLLNIKMYDPFYITQNLRDILMRGVFGRKVLRFDMLHLRRK